MAGSLIKIDEEIVTSAVASVTLGGADWDSSYDVYMVKFENVKPSTDNKDLNMQLTTSGTPDISSNYDYAHKILRADTTFTNIGVTNTNRFSLVSGVGNTTGERANGVIYCFNFNNASEYSFITYEMSAFNTDINTVLGNTGGGTLTVAQATNGLFFYNESSDNFASGSTFTLYGLAK
jgi:hypothetical protein